MGWPWGSKTAVKDEESSDDIDAKLEEERKRSREVSERAKAMQEKKSRQIETFSEATQMAFNKTCQGIELTPEQKQEIEEIRKRKNGKGEA